MDGEVHEPGLRLEELWKGCNAIYRLSTSLFEVTTGHCQNCASEHGNDAFVPFGHGRPSVACEGGSRQPRRALAFLDADMQGRQEAHTIAIDELDKSV